MKSPTILFIGFILLFSSVGLEIYFNLFFDGLILCLGVVTFAIMGLYSQVKDSLDKY